MSGGRSAETAGVHQYLGRDKLRARLTEHLPDTTREPRRHTDERFAQGSATNGEQNHWTAEEVEEHLIATKAIHNEQAQSVEKIVSAHKSLKKGHSELAVSTEILRHAIMQIREQSQVIAMSKGQSHIRKRKQTEARIQPQH